ncbi:glutamate--tRNA ligase [Psychroserpens sp.]|uniref:glutamate--tRNA ligase n=1 Tax=Psychroserpens sp. TaxID=2020870 RepID=UPI001B042E68|nr:glutamate--tRNA ligase [Psychroserpens sp.]MBO6605359.1 glutamate--tRNA ligase [Psychroserpens sp.]MBO6629958.1 glutamate--tRNA ligase [Psychroserpens sp.]MBO6653832.1 glutamate--tRNA ligase [Psychroserpens sp.]MBO6682153.1 glutamate--tRNA ligase [Psychroserpens sp.]MBO6748733.1 glutamate--tRNA ligase [Psychroserpens sp.]
MTKPVRVRFAPSPTGPLHIGGVRTALFNYLFAKKHNGTFVLRIEDTDQNRYVEGAEDYIVSSLNWCNIPFDEGPGKDGGYGPYRQSERKHLYKQYADQLVANGHAYYAFDTAETLDFHRKDHEAKGKTFIYNWHNRLKLSNSLSLSEEEVKAKLDSGADYVIRFKSPQDETLHLKDIIRGDIKIDTNILDDKVLFKSDGMPTYHLANIVDDHLMEISHVIRGEEWLPSLALHFQLYDAFGWQAPEFAHLPLILKPTGKGKLSKRDGDKLGFPVFPLEWADPKSNEISRGYKEDGYFKEAMINFLAFLGWNPGTEQEIFSLEELVKAFELERVNKAGARFDPDKIKWFNHHYMQTQNDFELAKSFQNLHPELKEIDVQYIEMVVALVKERATFISDYWNLTHFFFMAPSSYDEKAFKKAIKEDTATLMAHVKSQIEHVEDFTVENLQDSVKGWITSQEIGFGKVMMPLRLALVGALQGPDVFDIIYMIGKAETLKRIDNIVAAI